MSVPDIVKKVFEDHGIANFEFKLFRQLPQVVYCVQYRESDFNFIARLLEHEGIYWYFEHATARTSWCSSTRRARTTRRRPASRCPTSKRARRRADTECVSTGASRARCAPARSR
jgi:uncharacterized protein involved in type VI secretion and phage assembly